MLFVSSVERKRPEYSKKLLDEGVLKAHVCKTFPFAEMVEAHLELESGKTVGKIIVTL
ncbi:zinc-binding dehydrogenase [Labilibaculum filiforme]|uniref:zinc-binding dehydrogenase n=1 Tax=Labilibaculum filiforme TaxID=1940526 RepID=UPI000C6E8B9F